MDLIRAIPATYADPQQQFQKYQELIQDWYVECSVTGEPIRLTELHYWNIEKNEVYSSPQVMPLWDRYKDLPKSEPKKPKKNKQKGKNKKNKKRKK